MFQTTSEQQNKNALENYIQRFLIKILTRLHGAISDRRAKHTIHVSQCIGGKKRLVATSTIVLCSIYWPCVIGNY